MCNLSREDFLPESIIKVHANLQEGKETQDTVLVEQSMNSFLEHLKTNMSLLKSGSNKTCNIVYSVKTEVTMSVSKMRVMERLILNLVKNAVDVKATEIEINCCTSQSLGSHVMTMEITDNGPGMTPSQLAEFFNRPLPVKSPGKVLRKVTNVEASRGEGTIMVNSVMLLIYLNSFITAGLFELGGRRGQGGCIDKIR